MIFIQYRVSAHKSVFIRMCVCLSVIQLLAGFLPIMVSWFQFSVFSRKLVHSFHFGCLLCWNLRNDDYCAPSRLHPQFYDYIIFSFPQLFAHALPQHFPSSIVIKILYVLQIGVNWSQNFCGGFLLLLYVFSDQLYALIMIFYRLSTLIIDLFLWV